jgi:hypothetical protein
MSTTIAALYVETDGCYFGLPGVDPWDEARDARKYAGPHPVVAHPPCQLWVNFAALNFKRYGGEHNRPGNDGGCFAAALASVREWGRGARASGLLECMGGAWASQPGRHGLAAGSARWSGEERMGLRGLAECLRPPGAQTDLALHGRRAAAGSAMGTPARYCTSRLVRPHQAIAIEARSQRHAARVPRCASKHRGKEREARNERGAYPCMTEPERPALMTKKIGP